MIRIPSTRIADSDQHDKEMTEHLLGILASMLRLLPAESAQRIRLLAKFIEKKYDKVERLMKLRQEYLARVHTVEQDIKVERINLFPSEQADQEDEWLSRRLDAGLSSLQVSRVGESSTILPIRT